jgi:hypothetical protein
MGDLAVVVVKGLCPQGLPLALLKATHIDAEMPRLAAAQAGHKEGGKELGKCPENIKWEGLRGVAISQRGDSFETIPEIFVSHASGDQSRDTKVPQIPQMTCLVEFLEERKTAILGEEVHEIPREGVRAVKDASDRCRSCRSVGGCRCLGSVILWGRRGGGGRECSSAGCHRACGSGSIGRRGGGRDGSLVKALLKVPHVKLQPTQINHRVSVVLPDDGEGLTFCGVDGVRCWRPSHRLLVRVYCDAAHDTNTPTYVELLGDLSTNVCCVGRLAPGLGVDALRPGLVGACGAAVVAVGSVATCCPMSADRGPKTTVGVHRCRQCRIRACVFA